MRGPAAPGPAPRTGRPPAPAYDGAPGGQPGRAGAPLAVP
ncbi:hypothetical protein SLI_1825 [Streptomyces lividans 1326]|uniref:Uncharacterized protein n=1 Tax=Streptomyces lividans 1326 TaxID=1200984 RepID=A0A7U9H9Q2_STRLI|nr:hypothetical protein SLI_1825 [Streptomyces lividans 1326]